MRQHLLNSAVNKGNRYVYIVTNTNTTKTCIPKTNPKYIVTLKVGAYHTDTRRTPVLSPI